MRMNHVFVAVIVGFDVALLALLQHREILHRLLRPAKIREHFQNGVERRIRDAAELISRAVEPGERNQMGMAREK